MEQNTPDWTIGELYSKAWNIIKKYKILWVFAAAALANSASNFNSSSNIDSQDLEKFFGNPASQNTTNKVSQVLGAATPPPWLETVSQIFSSIPLYFYFIFIIEIIILAVIGIIISLLYGAWTQGMMINSTLMATQDEYPAITTVSSRSWLKVKSVLWLQIIPFLALFGCLFLYLIALVVLIAVKLTPVAILSGILALGAFIYWVFMISLSSIWANRLLFTREISAKEAFKLGLQKSRKKMGAMVLLGLVNSMAGLIILGVIVAILAALFIGGYLAKGAALLSIGLLTVGVIGGIVFLLGISLVTGIIESFKATIWTLAFKTIERKYE